MTFTQRIDAAQTPLALREVAKRLQIRYQDR
jgi:hypothetical protein